MKTRFNISSLKRITLTVICLCSMVFYTKADIVAKHFFINLYGHILAFDLQSDFYTQRNECFNQNNLEQSVDALLKDTQTDSLIKQLNKHASNLHMDDMAFLLLLNKVTNEVLRGESDECKTIFKYVILHKKDFDVFIGYSKNTITLYGRTNFLIDNCLFVEQGNKKYFDLSFSQQSQPQTEQLLTVKHLGKSLPLVMNMINPPAFNAKKAKKVIPFEYDGFVYFFTANINQSLVEYYKELPTININTVYLNYGLSASATASLAKELGAATADMNTTESVDFLLRFVQTSFEYKKDEQVYGQEKFSFPEETLTNTFSDCEDKAMLFAVLVNKVLGLKTVALYYKDAKHINVAVQNWNHKVKGNVTFKDEDYIVCEPSGKGFNIGESATQNKLASLIDW